MWLTLYSLLSCSGADRVKSVVRVRAPPPRADATMATFSLKEGLIPDDCAGRSALLFPPPSDISACYPRSRWFGICPGWASDCWLATFENSTSPLILECGSGECAFFVEFVSEEPYDVWMAIGGEWPDLSDPAIVAPVLRDTRHAKLTEAQDGGSRGVGSAAAVDPAIVRSVVQCLTEADATRASTASMESDRWKIHIESGALPGIVVHVGMGPSSVALLDGYDGYVRFPTDEMCMADVMKELDTLWSARWP